MQEEVEIRPTKIVVVERSSGIVIWDNWSYMDMSEALEQYDSKVDHEGGVFKIRKEMVVKEYKPEELELVEQPDTVTMGFDSTHLKEFDTWKEAYDYVNNLPDVPKEDYWITSTTYAIIRL